MVLALGLAVCFALWWLSKTPGGLARIAAALPRHRIAGWAAVALAAGMMLHAAELVVAIEGETLLAATAPFPARFAALGFAAP